MPGESTGCHLQWLWIARLVHTGPSLVQVDLFDLGAHVHGVYRYVLNYTDRFTRHVWLRPLKDKTAAGVAHEVRIPHCHMCWHSMRRVR